MFNIVGEALRSIKLGDSTSSQREDGQFEKRLTEWFVQLEAQSMFQ